MEERNRDGKLFNHIQPGLTNKDSTKTGRAPPAVMQQIAEGKSMGDRIGLGRIRKCHDRSLAEKNGVRSEDDTEGPGLIRRTGRNGVTRTLRKGQHNTKGYQPNIKTMYHNKKRISSCGVSQVRSTRSCR